jgi:hypothetical protein
MPKFIITQTDRYEIEADSIEEAQIYWRNELLTGISSENELLDGSTTYEEIEEIDIKSSFDEMLDEVYGKIKIK